MARLIWNKRVDSLMGKVNPYNGTRISVSDDTALDDFRKAVQAEYARYRHCGLVVYKNTIAFMNRNNIETKEPPLQADSLLPNLGESLENALIVLVPSPRRVFSDKSYQLLGIEAWCKEYFTSIASRLSDFYTIRYNFCRPNIDDVLAAKNGKEGIDWDTQLSLWDYEQYLDDGSTRERRVGQPLVSIKLPDIYTDKEWEKLEFCVSCFSKHGYCDEKLTTEMIAFLQHMDKKALEIPYYEKEIFLGDAI
jgi:hypothetical protein